jgi:undecaprenyl-diphosphatase
MDSGEGMTTVHAIVLGVLQGLGEFLPISSSGHLIVVPWLMGWPDSGLAFDVALHLGTLAAVGFAFWRDWVGMIGAAGRGLAAGRPFATPDGRLLLYLALATVPGALAGLVLHRWAETAFRSTALVAFTMAFFGVVLAVADRRARRANRRGHRADRRGQDEFSLRDALLVGLAQAIAIVPGSSRSGLTISMALFLGHPRESSARFSFLLALPITAGAALVEVPRLFGSGADPAPVIVGMVAAAVSGLVAIRFLLAYVRTRTYLPFVYYRLAFAALMAALLLVPGAGLR